MRVGANVSAGMQNIFSGAKSKIQSTMNRAKNMIHDPGQKSWSKMSQAERDAFNIEHLAGDGSKQGGWW